jgi:TonB family protein
MRLHGAGKLGQSGYELVLAVLLSFFLHAALIALGLFVVFAIQPKIYVPPFYEVKLVGLPAPTSPLPSPGEAVTSPAKPEAAPVKVMPTQQSKKANPQPEKVAPKKEAVPVYLPKQPKAAPRPPAKAETMPAQPASAPAGAAQPATTGGKTEGGAVSSPAVGGKAEGVAVSSSSEDFKFPPYLVLVRDKIEQNWNPPPGAAGAKAKVEFTVLRSGRVGDAKLQVSSGNFYFDQAAVRAILMSSPLPPMPEGFYKDYAVFIVDLQEKD